MIKFEIIKLTVEINYKKNSIEVASILAQEFSNWQDFKKEERNYNEIMALGIRLNKK